MFLQWVWYGGSSEVELHDYLHHRKLVHRDNQDTHYRVESDHNVHGARDFWPLSNQYPEKGMVNELYGGITENKNKLN